LLLLASEPPFKLFVFVDAMAARLSARWAVGLLGGPPLLLIVFVVDVLNVHHFDVKGSAVAHAASPLPALAI
jgi:hypothetical protein